MNQLIRQPACHHLYSIGYENIFAQIIIASHDGLFQKACMQELQICAPVHIDFAYRAGLPDTAWHLQKHMTSKPANASKLCC